MNLIHTNVQRIGLFFTFLFISLVSFAQEKGVDINVDVNKKENWYTQPWIWIVGGAVFILLLVALLRGGEKRA